MADKKKNNKKKIDKSELEKLIKELSKTLSPSQIGNKIKREYGITVKKISGKMGKFLSKNNLQKFPEDLNNVVEKMKKLKEHVGKNRGDKKVSRSVHITEGRIRKLANYYKKKKKIPKDWKSK